MLFDVDICTLNSSVVSGVSVVASASVLAISILFVVTDNVLEVTSVETEVVVELAEVVL